ncbi:hypothetical protein B0919_23715 [Hymenobacter sp. CRA2]|nr:hypothetical protein B0919_23715 [Hymenobacter sp. CRA2]
MRGRWALLSRLWARLRVRATRAGSRWLLGARAGDLAYSGLRSIEEVSGREFMVPHLIRIDTLHPPRTVRYAFDAPALPRYFRQHKAFAAELGYELQDVCVAPASGLAWLPEAPYVLLESIGCLQRLAGWADLVPELLQRPTSLPEPGPVIVCPVGPFYHWLFEMLPAVLLARQWHPEARLLLPATTPAYVEQALRRALPAEDWDRLVLRAAGAVRVPHLLLIARDDMSGFVRPEALRLLRRTFVPDPAPAYRHVYISRRHTANRAAAREEALEAGLRERGFEVVYAERLSFEEQIALLREARTLVGLHGAGLSHLVWATGPLTVAEIFPDGVFNDCYARLTVSLGFDYQPYFCGTAQQHDQPGPLPVADILGWLDGWWRPATPVKAGISTPLSIATP